MKHLSVIITAQHQETQETPIRSAFSGFLTKLPTMGFSDPVCTIEFDAELAPPPPALNPWDHTVAEIEALAPELSGYDLAEGIVAEVLGKRRVGAIEALADALAALGDPEE